MSADTPIVSSDLPVTLVGGGELSHGDLADALALAPRLVAADGGADQALAAGYVPEAVIGDLDSLSDEARRRLDPKTIHHISEQDSTDFDKAMRRISAPLVVGVGFLGRRMDHSLAALSGLLARPRPRAVLLGPWDIALHLCPGQTLSLNLEPGTRVSLFPFGSVTGVSQGLEWPVDGLAFSPATQIGTSNVATGPVQIQMDRAGMILLVPRECLNPVVTALAAPAALAKD